MSKDFWNSRYSDPDFAYGTEPNIFFKEQIEYLKPTRALFLAEGEGRNAVYAAKLGWDVDSVDFSNEAKSKALSLAEKSNVKINYDVCDLNEYNIKEDTYDLVVMIFVHLPLELRKKVFAGTIRSLINKGRVIIEVFGKEQINNTSGGPRSVELLYSENEILDLVTELKTELIESKVIILEEGEHHKGSANVIRYVGVKV